MSDNTSRSGDGTDMAKAKSKFIKALTPTDATMLVADAMIGSAVFIRSADIAQSVQTPFWLISALVLTESCTNTGACQARISSHRRTCVYHMPRCSA